MRVAGGDDRAEHAVLDILRPKPLRARLEEPGVFEEDDPVADGELPHASLRVKFTRDGQCAFIFHDVAQRFIEPPYVVIGMGENEQFVTTHANRLFFIGILLDEITASARPVSNDALHSFSPALRLDNMPPLRISIQPLLNLAAGEKTGGLSRPLFTLAPHTCKFGRTDPFGNRPKGCAGLDRLKLHCIADQNHLGSSLLGALEHTRHLLRRDHAGFIDDKDVPPVEEIASFLPSHFP